MVLERLEGEGEMLLPQGQQRMMRRLLFLAFLPLLLLLLLLPIQMKSWSH